MKGRGNGPGPSAKGPEAHRRRTQTVWPGCSAGSRTAFGLEFFSYLPFFSKLLDSVGQAFSCQG